MALSPSLLRELRKTAVGPAGNRLADAIQLANTTQIAVAKATGLTNTYISDVARGRYRSVTVENAHKLADHFGCHIEDLFPSSEEPEPRAQAVNA